jgi:heat shock protein HslJ
VVNGTLFEEPDKEASIQFQNIVSTRAACENAERETALLIALEEVESVRVGRNKSVIMLDKNGKTKLILNRIASR